MKKPILAIVLLVTATPLWSQLLSHANNAPDSPLSQNVGTAVQLTRMRFNVGNNFDHKTWVLRSVQGNGWDRTQLVDGIDIDDSFSTPSTARTWWKRNAATGAQYWGDMGNTYLTLNGGRLGLGTTTPSSPLDVHVGTQTVVTTGMSVYRNGDPNYGIKLVAGRGDDTSYEYWNGGLASWNGIGFYCTLDNTTRGVFDTRNGNFALTGSINSELNAVFKGSMWLGKDQVGVSQIKGPAYSGAIEIKTHSAAGGPANRYLRLGMIDNTGAFGPALSISDDLKVGVGTTAPDEALTVKGTIHTQEVRVDLNGALAPPDYVFEKTYQLPDLKSVEKYIEANKHLPEVPSAKEMEANGVKLLEMNLLLLKKVEELTLYLIEQQKKIETLESKFK